MKQLIPLVLLVSLASCQPSITTPEDNYNLKLTFVNKVDTQKMQLGQTYQNAFGESYTLTGFKYYISNIGLAGENTGETTTNIYHLVDEAVPATTSFVITAPYSRFSRLSFFIGVDSIRNVSGTQSGDLDPAKGMFWTWNSGYVMAKLEGTSPASAAPANSVSLHVGGFRTGENTVRKIEPTIPAGATIQLSHNRTTEVVIEADAAKWFKGQHDLPISANPLCHNPGPLAVKFADNYSQMFKIIAINN